MTTKKIKAWAIWKIDESRMATFSEQIGVYIFFPSKESAVLGLRDKSSDSRFKVVPVQILLPTKKKK